MQTITINVPDGCEVQIVRKEEKKEPVIKTYQDLIDNNIRMKGFFIDTISRILNSEYLIAVESNKNIASSEKIAKSMLAMAQISQLMPYYGGEVTNEEWVNENVFKFSIIRIGNSISFLIQAKSIYSNYYYLTFHTDNMMREFLKSNEQLVKDYLMID